MTLKYFDNCKAAKYLPDSIRREQILALSATNDCLPWRRNTTRCLGGEEKCVALAATLDSLPWRRHNIVALAAKKEVCCPGGEAICKKVNRLWKLKPLVCKPQIMSAQLSPRKCPRISNHALAAILSRLVRDATKYGGIAKAKLVEALMAVKEFQTVLMDGLSMTGRYGVGATEVFLTVRFK